MSAGCNISGAFTVIAPIIPIIQEYFQSSLNAITAFFCCTCGMMHVLFRLSAISVALPYFLYLLTDAFLYVSHEWEDNAFPLLVL